MAHSESNSDFKLSAHFTSRPFCVLRDSICDSVQQIGRNYIRLAKLDSPVEGAHRNHQ